MPSFFVTDTAIALTAEHSRHLFSHIMFKVFQGPFVYSLKQYLYFWLQFELGETLYLLKFTRQWIFCCRRQNCRLPAHFDWAEITS